MNEAIRIHVQVDGQPAQIAFFDDGIMLNGETSASHRGVAINLTPADPITEFRAGRIRMIHDWGPHDFSFKVGGDAGGLLCTGVDDTALPFGRYNLRIAISDLKSNKGRFEVEIPDNGQAQVTADFRTDPRDVRLTVPVEQFDDRIKAVLLNPQSRLDDRTIPEWLAGPARPQRKACLLNLMAKARAANSPNPGSYLIDRIRSVFFAEVDRIYASAAPDLVADLKTLSADRQQPFYAEGTPMDAMHRRLLDHIGPQDLGLEPEAASFGLLSFRQEGGPCMQLVVASPPGNDPARTHYADLDIDLGNPLQDVAGLFTHFGEIINPAQTDHLNLANRLAKGETAKYLFYRVVRKR